MKTIKFKFLVIIFYTFFSSLLLYAQPGSKRYYLKPIGLIGIPEKISEENLNEEVVLKLQFSINELNEIFNQYEIYKYELAFPTSKKNFLQNIYEIHCNSLLIEHLQKLNNKYFELIEEIPEPFLLYTPNDYSLNGSHYALDLINAKQAWDITKGNSNIIIGISDTGFDLNHEDLTSQIVHVVSNNTQSLVHGTFVAGCAASATDNNKGIAAIGFNSKLMVTSNWANDNEMLQLSQLGAKVLNASWINRCSFSSIGQAVYDEIYENGTVVFAGAGNGTFPDGTPRSSCGNGHGLAYPASYNHVISVSSVGSDNAHWDFTEGTTHTHNSAVDIVAPGYVVLSLFPNNTYGTSSGTSFSSPICAGIAALMFAVNPCLSPDEVEFILKLTADPIADGANYQGLLGAGRVNAYEAVKYAAGEKNFTITSNTTWSDSEVTGNITISNGITLNANSIINIKDGKKITINSGAKLILEGTIQGICADWDGIIEVKPGGTLELKNGALIKLKGNGKIVAEYNYSNGTKGKVIYHPGAIINLQDNNSMVDIAGELEVKANAEFTFTGNGYVKFSRQGWMNNTPNIIAGSGSKFTLNGSGKTDKVLEATQETVIFPAPMEFKLTNGAAHLGTDVRLSLDANVHLDNARITSLTGTSQNYHRGIHMYGQPNVHINNCDFEYGSYGIYATLTYLGNSLNISASTFKNINDRGLVSIDKGVNLTNVRFENIGNQGWDASGMTFNSQAYRCTSLTNFQGVRYHGSSALFLDRPYLWGNEIEGIEFSASTLSMYCARISNNGLTTSRPGVRMKTGTHLNLSPGQVPSSGRNIITNNHHSVVLECSGQLHLLNGGNNFQPASGTMAFTGTTTAAGTCSSPNITATGNRWKSNLTSPVNGVDYAINTCTCFPVRQITITDNSPGTQTCPLIFGGMAAGGESEGEIASEDISLDMSTPLLADYAGGMELLKQAKYTEAFSAFENTLNLSATSSNEFNAQQSAYFYMNYILAEVVKNDQMLGSNNSKPMLDKVLAVQENRINKADNYSEKYIVSMDRAKTFVLVNQREEAIKLFSEIMSWPDLEETEDVQKWLCLVTLEENLLKGKIAKEDFYELYKTCSPVETKGMKQQEKNNPGQSAAGINNPVDENSANQAAYVEDAAWLNNIQVYPNPTSGIFTVEADKLSEIIVQDILGSVVFRAKPQSRKTTIDLNAHPKGVYIVKLVNGNEFVNKRIVTQ
jgi:subtilisin family serine protease